MHVLHTNICIKAKDARKESFSANKMFGSNLLHIQFRDTVLQDAKVMNATALLIKT